MEKINPLEIGKRTLEVIVPNLSRIYNIEILSPLLELITSDDVLSAEKYMASRDLHYSRTTIKKYWKSLGLKTGWFKGRKTRSSILVYGH